MPFPPSSRESVPGEGDRQEGAREEAEEVTATNDDMLIDSPTPEVEEERACAAEVTEGGVAEVTEGGMAEVTEGGVAEVTEGGMAEVTEGGVSKVTDGGVAEMTEGGVSKVTEEGVADGEEGVVKGSQDAAEEMEMVA